MLAYRWNHEDNLEELCPETGMVRLRVHRDDYVAVVQAARACADEGGLFKVKAVLTSAKREWGELVPTTQVYVVMRYLIHVEYIRKSAGNRKQFVNRNPFEGVVT